MSENQTVSNGSLGGEPLAEILQVIIETIPEIVIIFDTQSHIVKANRVAVNTFGIDPAGLSLDALIQRLNICRLSGTQIDPFELPVAKVLGKEKVSSYRFKFGNVDGAQRTVRSTAAPLFRAGTLIGAVAIWTDITAYERLLNELDDERALMKAIVDSAPEGIVVADAQARIFLANPVAEAICARPIPIGREYASHAELYFRAEDGSDVDPRALPLTRAALDGENSVNQPLQVTWPDGQVRHLIASAAPIRNSEGIITGAVSVFQDLTSVKQTENRLRAANDRLASVLSSITDSYYVVDRQWRFLEINPAAEKRIFKRPASELLGKVFWDEYPQGLHKEFHLQYQRAFDENCPVHFEAPSNITGGWFEVHAYPREFGIEIYLRDITERRQAALAEANLEVQHRLLDQREQERLQLARDLHDGPIQEIIGLTFAVQETLEMTEDPDLRGKLQTIQATLQQEIRNIRGVCNELRPPVLAPFGLEKAIRSHIESFESLHPELSFRLELEDDRQHLPEGTRLALYRIYQEALNNIVRHAGPCEVTIRYRLRAEQAVLEIEDTGKGFEVPASWVDVARKGHLGLVGIQERVEALKGRAEIFSAPGRGTQLVIRVPILES